MMTDNDIQLIIIAIIASSGFWAFLQFLIQKIYDKKSKSHKMLLGLGHDRIIFLEKTYLKRGWITPDEYENLHDYLYEPYLEMGGNGTAQKLMNDVMKLPISSQKPED